MPALTRAYESLEKPGLVIAYPVAPETTVFKGGLVGVNAAGQAVPMSASVANLRFVGVALESAQAGTRVTVAKCGTFVYPINNFNDVTIGASVHALFDGEVRISPTGLANAYVVGTVISRETCSLSTTAIRIRIDRHTQ